MISHWESLNLRERMYVVGGASAALVLIIYAAVWLPFARTVAQLKQKTIDHQQTIAWVNQNKAELMQLRNMQPIVTQKLAKPILSTI